MTADSIEGPGRHSPSIISITVQTSENSTTEHFLTTGKQQQSGRFANNKPPTKKYDFLICTLIIVLSNVKYLQLYIKMLLCYSWKKLECWQHCRGPFRHPNREKNRHRLLDYYWQIFYSKQQRSKISKISLQNHERKTYSVLFSLLIFTVEHTYILIVSGNVW